MWSFVDMSGKRIWRRNADYKWVCDCADYETMEPMPDHLGECMVCRRPVYDENGVRVTRSAADEADAKILRMNSDEDYR